MNLAVLVIVATFAGLAGWTGARRLSGPLAVAIPVIVLGGLVPVVLALSLDGPVDEWATDTATAFSTDVLDAITNLGRPPVVIALAVAVGVVETIRTRNAWAIPFLALVVAGNGVLTTTVKHLVDRARPELNPAAAALGPSFPSGHSSWAAAFFAATALLAMRGRSRRAQALIAGACAATAATVAATRVLLGVHWLSDALAGLALGAAWCGACAYAMIRCSIAPRRSTSQRTTSPGSR